MIAGRALAAALVVVAWGCTPRRTTGELRVERAEVRVLPSRVGALYLEIDSDAPFDDRLTGVDSPTAADAQLHELVQQDGVSLMREAPAGFDIPAGGTLVLERGGNHAMLFGVDDRATHMSVTLRFARAPAMTLDVPVRSAMQP